MTAGNQSVISLELNEINFDFIKLYIAKGELPNFAKLLDKYTLFETVSEKHYPYLEPWIQWPTVYSGKSYSEHQIFRLGDIVETDYPQIWEALEERKLRVAAISPMNAANRCESAAFFVPDPWTVTDVTGDRQLKELYELVRFIVNNNSSSKFSVPVLSRFLLAFVKTLRPQSIPQYMQIFKLASKYKWARAMVLDRLLADIFIEAWKKTRPDYGSIFLNAGAHIQHHHMYECAAYSGNESNPEWYSKAGKDGVDPVLSVYKLYDQVIAELLRLPHTRFMITTGLSQTPNPKRVFQYRFVQHESVLRRLGIEDAHVVPRMSRDFLVEFPNAEAAARGAERMRQVYCAGAPMFEIEDRGDNLFCKICYFGEREAFANATVGNQTVDLANDVVLVSIENGIHQSIGYHVDTGFAKQNGEDRRQIPLTSIYGKTLDVFAVGEAA